MVSEAFRAACATARAIGLDMLGLAFPAKRKGGFYQPLWLIPGMPAAPEPVSLPTAWEGQPLKGAWALQTKVDGLRAIYVSIRILTRNALPLDCALHCLRALRDLELSYDQPMVFDGEYVEDAGFQATLSAHKRGEGTGTFYIFDAVPYAEWKANKFTQPLRERLKLLREKMAAMGDQHFVSYLPYTEFDTVEELEAAAQAVWANGGEGVVAKRLASTYTRGRTKDWFKVKKTHTEDVTITDLIIEDGRVKAVLAKMEDGKVVKVGSNIPADLRREMAIVPGAWTGKVMEIGFKDRTESGALKGGYFICMRDDK